MKKASQLPLSALRVFEAAARHESFRKAASDLNITQSAISHQISNLETHLGRDLFKRAGRRVELTETGRVFLPYIREAFERIEAGAKQISGPLRKELTVQIYVTVAARWMMSRLHRLQMACPDLLVRFNASQMGWEFEPSSADIGIISTRDPVRPELEYVPLFEANLIAVCAPGLLAGNAPLNSPIDMLRFTLLEVYTARSDWDIWLGAAGIRQSSDIATIRFDSYLLALEAACDRQGIAIVPDFLAAPDIGAGRLVQPIAHKVAQPEKWYLVARAGRMAEPSIAMFRQWLLDEVETRHV